MKLNLLSAWSCLLLKNGLSLRYVEIDMKVKGEGRFSPSLVTIFTQILNTGMNNNYQTIIFDLDGTLVNSLEDIADAMNRTLIRFGYPAHPYQSYKYFVGNGLKNLVYQSLPQENKNEEDVILCLQVMMEEYGRSYAEKTKLYEGIADLLDYLTQKKIKMAVLSNKADVLTQKIASKLLKNWSFEIILGASKQFPHKPDPEAALFIASKMNALPENILYLGDSNVDMKTANAAGMFPIGAAWGFRTREELFENGAKIVIDRPQELIDIKSYSHR